jgi:peptidyl-prolyl cis-trans isomerase D
MLDLLRRQAQSKFIQATIIIIILVFIFWGVGTNQGNGTNAVAQVNGESIPYSDYQKEYDRLFNQLREQFGGTIPKGLLETTNFKEQVVNKLIQTTLMRQGAQDIGLYVSDKELRQTIEDMEAFKNNGVFDVKWYEEVLTGSRLSVARFEEGMRYDLLSAKIIDHLQRFAQTSENELQDIYKYNYDRINLQYAAFSAADFKDKVPMDEDGLKAFFEKNKESYKSLPQVQIKYIHILPLSGEGLGTGISDDELLREYNRNIEQYTIPEQRQVRHILLLTNDSDTPEQISEKRAAISTILEKAKAGEDFGELAKQFSEDGSAGRGGDLGFFSRGQMVKPFEDAAFSLNDGEISDIVQTQFGFHIIKLEAIKEGAVRPFDEAKGEIAASLQAKMGQTLVFQKANETYEKIILSGSIDKYAASLPEGGESGPGKITETGFFSQQDPPEKLRTLPALVNSAFTLKKGELSSIVDTGQGYAIVYVQDRKEPVQQKFDSVREQAREDFVKNESARLAKEAAERFLAKLQEGANFTEEAAAQKITVETTGFISRGDYSAAKLPPQVLQKNFNLSETSPYAAEVAETGDTLYVVAFKDKQNSDPNNLDETKQDALTRQLTEQKANSLLSAWAGYLREQADITVNEKLL